MADAMPPPSPENLPPPPSVHPKLPDIAATQPISTVVGNDEVQCRAMDNFRALVLKFAKPLLPAQQSLIEQRLRDFFPNQLHVPDHPPYAAMIQRALVVLNDEEGSNEKAISEFIKNEYHDLPWAHDTMLKHHLHKLTETGDIFLTSDGCYLLRSAITHPNHLHSLNPFYDSCPSSTPCCTSSSSPCSSYFSSTSSSTSSSRSPSPCHGSRRNPLKRKRKRKPKLIQGRGRVRGRPRKNVQGRVRGRPRKGSQGVGEGTSHQNILKRKVGRPRKIKFAEEEREEENAGQMVLAQQDAVPRTGPQGQGNEILREQGEHQHQKIIAGRKKNQPKEQKSHAIESMVISGEVEICKEQNVVIDEQGWQQQNARGRPRKNIQGTVRGRPCKKSQGAGEGTSRQKVRERRLGSPGKIKLAEEERDEENAGQMVLAQNQAEEQHDAVTRSSAHGQEDKLLREQGERQNQEIVAGEKKNQVQESHGTEERNHVNEKVSIVIVGEPCNEHNAVIDEQAQLEFNISIKEQQHVINISDSEYGGPFEECNEQSKPVEGKSVEQNQSEKEENCFVAEQNQPQEKQMEENKEESRACSWHRVVWLPVRRRRRQCNETEVLHQEEQEKDEMPQEEVQLEDLVKMNNDAEEYACIHEDGAQQKEERGGSVRQDQLQEEQNSEVDHQQQVMDISEEALVPCQRQGLPMDQNQPRELELVVEKLCRKEGRQNEVIPGALPPENGGMKDQNLMMISEARDTSVVENRNGREKQVKGSSIEQIEPEQDNVRRVQDLPMPEQMAGTEINIQHCGNQQSGCVEQDQNLMMIDKRHQLEGETSEMVQKRIELKDEITEKQHYPMIIKNKAQPKGASMEWNKSEEQQNDATGGQVQAEEQYTEWTGEKFQPFTRKEKGSVEHNQLEKQEIQQADKLYKQEEQQNQVIHKDMQEVSEENHGVMVHMEAPVEGTSIERNEAKNQEDDATGEQVQSQAKCMKGTKEKFLQCRQEEMGNVELDQIEGEAELSDEQHKQEEEFKVIQTEDQHDCHGVMTIQGIQEGAREEQHGSGEGVGGSTSQLIHPRKECKEWTGEKIQLFGQQPSGSVDQDILEKMDVEIGDRWRPREEQENELIQKEIELVEEGSKEQRNAVMTQYEAQEVEGSMEHNEFKKEQSDVAGGKVQLQVQCVEGTKDQIQLCGPEQGGSVEKSESEQQQVDVIREEVQSEEQCFQGTNTKFLPCGRQEKGGVELGQLDRGVEMADRKHKPEEQQNEITRIESELRGDRHLVLTHTEAHDDQSMEEAKAMVEKNHSEERENAVTEKQNYPRLLCSGGIEKNIQPSVEEKYPKRQVKFQYDQQMKIFDREIQVTQYELRHSHSQLSKSEPTKTTPIILSLPSNYQQPGLRSLWQGLRSGKKMPEEAENQHEQIKPSQRVLRRHKTNPEFAPATEQSLDKDVDHTNEQVKHRRRGKPRKQNVESATADDKDIDHSNEPIKDRRRGNPPKRKSESAAVEGASRPQRITRARS